MLLAAGFGVLHHWWRGRVAQRFFRDQFTTDVAWWYCQTLVGSTVAHATLVVTFMGLALLLGYPVAHWRTTPYAGFGPVAHWPAALQAVLGVLLLDLCGYWVHRRFHRGRWWPWHAVHHSPEELDWLSAVRVHPLSEALAKALGVLPVLAVGVDPRVAAPLAPLAGLYAIFVHANLNWDFGPLRTVIASPVFHRWHHSRDPLARDKNFAGLLPLWDWLFGTLYLPRDRQPTDFGVADPLPPTFWGQLAHPFRRRAPAPPTGPAAPPAAQSAP